MSPATAYYGFVVIGIFGLIGIGVSMIWRWIAGEFEDDPDVDADLAHPGQSFFRPLTIGVMAVVFSAAGALAIRSGVSILTSVGIGGVGALGSTWLGYIGRQYLLGTEGLTGPSSDAWSRRLIGSHGHVLVAIPEGGTGQVGCVLGASLVCKQARTVRGEALPMNAHVRIEDVVGDVLIVGVDSLDRS